MQGNEVSVQRILSACPLMGKPVRGRTAGVRRGSFAVKPTTYLNSLGGALQQSHPDLTPWPQSHKLDREDLLTGLTTACTAVRWLPE